MRLKRLGNRGDTIVEVLLAIAVVSAVLGGAYVATNRSLGGVRQSQERGEALKFVEGQLERLKEAAQTDPALPANDVFITSTNPFCLNNSLAVQNPGSASCNQGTDSRYHLEIERSLADDTYTFTARATWTRLGGAQDELELIYRTYRP